MPPPKDPEKRKLWFERQKAAREKPEYYNPSWHKKGEPAWNKDKRYVNVLGPEKAAEISKKMSDSHKGVTPNREYLPQTQEQKLFNKLHLLLLVALGRKPPNQGNPSNYKHPPEKRVLISNATKKQWENFHETQEEYWKDHPLGDRRTFLYYQWREKCLERDSYTCQCCGITEEQLPVEVDNPAKNHMHVHHIKCWNLFTLLRHELSNGITLCPECHWKEEERIRKVLGAAYQLVLRSSKAPPLPPLDLVSIEKKLEEVAKLSMLEYKRNKAA